MSVGLEELPKFKEDGTESRVWPGCMSWERVAPRLWVGETVGKEREDVLAPLLCSQVEYDGEVMIGFFYFFLNSR